MTIDVEDLMKIGRRWLVKPSLCRSHSSTLMTLPSLGTDEWLKVEGFCSQLKPLSGSEMTIDIGEFDEDWQKVAGQTFTMQKSFFNPHDFAISENHYVFFQNAMSFKMVSFAVLRCMLLSSHCVS